MAAELQRSLLVPPSLGGFCRALTTVVTLKVDPSEGQAKGPRSGLRSHFRNARELLYFPAEIKAFWFSTGGDGNGVSVPVMPAPGPPYLCTQGVHPGVVQRL